MSRLIEIAAFLVIIAFSPSVASADKLDPLDYPVSEEISLGLILAQVRPEKFMKVESPLNGLLHLRKRSGFYEKGTVWSEVEPERLALDKESFKLKSKLFEVKEKPASLLEIADSRIALENRRDELKLNMVTLGDILNEPELADLYLGNSDKDDRTSKAKVAKLRSRIAKQLEAIEKALEYVGTPEQKRLELRVVELELQRAEQQLAQKERETRFKMPFSGELKFVTEIPENLDEALELQVNQPIAEISHYGRLECQVIVSKSSIRQMPASSLILVFPRSSGFGEFKATFKRKENREVYGKPETIYIFQFSAKEAELARTLIGGRIQGKLVYRLKKPAYLIPKLDVVEVAYDEVGSQGWRMGIQTILPDWQALVIGESQIALAKKEKSDE